MMHDEYISRMDTDIGRLVREAARLAWRFPRYLFAFARLARAQAAQAELRAKARAEGVQVPAFLIVSVTRKCNLSCAGCYSRAAHGREVASGRGEELDSANLARVIDEGAELGVSFALIAGGEPLVRAAEVVDMARRNPNVIFPVFTNGYLINGAMVASFKRYRNLIPVISVEGGAFATDRRRGAGTHAEALSRMEALRRAGVFFGVSVTVMKGNVRELMSVEFVRETLRAGAGALFYNEYTPIEEGTESLCIDAAERTGLLHCLDAYKRKFPALFLAFPGDEDKFGGCLSSGRGFVHVAPDGQLEACPFAPFGDTSARDTPLREALKSPILREIRAHHDELTETVGGCALWNRREWAESLIVAASAELTGI